MRKKLNRKLKFALAGFGAFALAGVSCVGFASLENQDAIVSYAIDVPTAGNDVELGIYTFKYSSGDYYVSAPTVAIDVGDLFASGTGDGALRFSPHTSPDDYTASTMVQHLPYTIVDGVISFTLSDGQLFFWSNSDALSTLGESTVPIFQFTEDTVTYRIVLNSYVDTEFTVEGDVFINGGYSYYNAYAFVEPVPPTPVDYVHDIVDILVAGITKLGQGIGQGVSSFVTSLAFNTAGDGLSVYFVLVCVFGGIALAVALTSKIFMWLNGLGA